MDAEAEGLPGLPSFAMAENAPPPAEAVEKSEFVPSTLWRQKAVYDFYMSTPAQVAVAVVIGLNFLTNIIEKQIDPFGDVHDTAFGAIGLVYNILFTIELGLNMYGSWFRHFWISGWNIFDFVVVSIGVINTIKLPLPPAFSLLRMMRAFRVFRLFKRVKSLNKIIVSIVKAVPGVLNAFLILAIVMSIYAILGVEFYQDVGQYCNSKASPKYEVDQFFRTVRGHCAGEEYFGTFSKSLFSFFQCLTGESWSEAVARPMIWYYIDDPLLAIGGGFFFMSYIIASMFVLTNVVVAVLLDKMVDPETEEAVLEDVDGEDTASKISVVQDAPLENLTAQVSKISTFSCNMRTNLDNARKEMVSLREQIDTVLRLVQQDGSGKV